MHYNIVFIFYLQHGRKSKQVYWMLPMMDDMYNQLYMLPNGQCFYIMEPAFLLMLGHSDIFSISSYSLAIIKKNETAIQQQPDEKKNNFWKYIFFLQSEVEVQIVLSEDDTKIEMVPVMMVLQPSVGETPWPELVVKYLIIALGSQVFIVIVVSYLKYVDFIFF